MAVEALIQIVAPLPTAIPVIAVFPVTLAVAFTLGFALSCRLLATTARGRTAILGRLTFAFSQAFL